MNKEERNKFISSIDIDDFNFFYKNNNNKIVLEKYNISYYDLNIILKELNITPKNKEEIKALISKNLLSKSDAEKKKITEKRLQTRNNWTDDYRKSLSEKQSQIRRNFSLEQKQHQLEAFRNTVSKRTEEEKALIKKHKSEATKKYFKNMTDDERKAFSEKMSIVYSNLSDEIKEQRKLKISNTYRKNCQLKYGVDNAFQVPTIKDKIKQTNLDRYGVEYACQLNQCRLAGNNSKINQFFESIFLENEIEFSREYSINSFSYDFKIGNNLIEINPTATHNSTWSPFPNQEKDKLYHYKKTKLAVDNNFRCINIWDWDDIDKIIYLLKNKEKLYARKCSIKELDLNTTREYLNRYHLQGFIKFDLSIGLFFNEELVSIMTFGKPRYNKKYEWELLRYCSSYNVIGGAQKLFSYFIKKYNPKSIISYCDLSKFTGNIYKKLGFVYKNYSIGKHWFNSKTKQHITDNLLRQRGFDQLFGTSYGKGTSNERLMLDNDFVEIYDAGQAVYEYLKK